MAWDDGNVGSIEVLIMTGDSLFDSKNYIHAIRIYQEAYNSAMCVKKCKNTKSISYVC